MNNIFAKMKFQVMKFDISQIHMSVSQVCNFFFFFFFFFFANNLSLFFFLNNCFSFVSQTSVKT